MEVDALNQQQAPSTIEQTWPRVAGLQPRLADQVQCYQHEYRGQNWLIIADQAEERYFRASENADSFIKRLDGTSSVERIHAELERESANPLSRGDVILLLGNLKSAGLLLPDDEAPAHNPDDRAERYRFRFSSLSKPFAIRIPLFDPDGLLQRMALHLRWLPVPVVILTWLLVLTAALVGGGLHWPELTEYGAARFNDPLNLLYFWLLYPLVKGLHELAHALATRLWGGVVHDMGIMLLVFFPVPYVDSSAAHRFSSRPRRILVSAAGIMMETFLASLAVLWWLNSDGGLGRDLAFDIMVIGGFSTLLFNANPLLKFDGYYMFSEWIQVPNLSSRSQQYLGYLFQRYLLGIYDARSPVTAVGEAKWLFGYGIAAALYRLFISLIIAFWVAGRFFILGMLLAFWALIYQLLIPFAKSMAKMYVTALSKQRLLRLAVVAGVLVSSALTLMTLPMQYATYAQGIIDLPDDAPLRCRTEGIIRQVHVRHGARVNKGDPIITLENIELETQQAVIRARLQEAQARLNAVLLNDRTQAEILKNRFASLQAELDELNDRIEGLVVVSTSDGVMVIPQAEDLPGRFIERGDLIGYNIRQAPATARIVVSQHDIERVRRDRQGIEIRLNGDPHRVHPARMLREIPMLTNRLPSRYLGTSAGGDIAVDSRDERGLLAMNSVYQVELELPHQIHDVFIGQRLHVRIRHSEHSLAQRLVQRLQQLWIHELT